jgi:outer membrane autotransporter protein
MAMAIGKANIDLRLGWLHEFADVGRPMTASFVGASGNAFTVFGATPERDSAAIGLGINARIADGAVFYARYDGEVLGATNNNAFTAGIRATW